MWLRVCILLFVAEFVDVSGFIGFPFDAETSMATFLTTLRRPQHSLTLDFAHNLTPGHLCRRPCLKNYPKVCHFQFTLEFYQTLGGACKSCTKGNQTHCFNSQCVTADGVERTFMSVNRQLPGPSIQVCKDDIIVVDVDNQMEGTATSIHWHGLLQRGTQYSDGVPFLSQCPIAFSTAFRYVMHAHQTGTHLYHSHAGQHKANGVYGALVIRSSLVREFDVDGVEFYVLCSDWMHVHAEEYFPGLPSHISLFDSILINGRGQFYNKSTRSHQPTPLTIYRVHTDKRYLFRIINAASNVCPFQLQIESHNFTVMATDGADVTPVTVERLFFTSGERYDIVVDTRHRAMGDYFMRVRALSPCNDTVEQFAVIRYVSQEMTESVSGGFTERKLPVSGDEVVVGNELIEMESKVVREDIVGSAVDHRFELYFATPQLDNRVVFGGDSRVRFMVTSDKFNNNNVGTINNISFTLPHNPLLPNRHNLSESIFCNSTHKAPSSFIGSSSISQCTHRIKVKLNSIVELLLIDIEDHSRHPFHLHGHKFFVMEIGKINDAVRKNHRKPLLKDTVTIPSNGYVRVRFRADNAGFWLAHCHFDYHLAVGMGFILQVGEASEMGDVPEGFGRDCGGFMPSGIKIFV